jgi:hypothetical protein
MDASELDDEGHLMQPGTVLAVQQLENMYTCIFYKLQKVIPNQAGLMGSCQICKADQRLRVPRLTAKQIVEEPDGNDHMKVRAYHDILAMITGSDGRNISTQDIICACSIIDV